MPHEGQPEGYGTVIPYMIVRGVDALTDFMGRVFDGELAERLVGPDGNVMHAEVRIGDSIIMMGERSADYPAHPASLYVYVPDTDATYQRAIKAGATSISEPVDTFYGDRNAGVEDPFGNRWWIATKIQQVPAEEIERRAREPRERR